MHGKFIMREIHNVSLKTLWITLVISIFLFPLPICYHKLGEARKSFSFLTSLFYFPPPWRSLGILRIRNHQLSSFSFGFEATFCRKIYEQNFNISLISRLSQSDCLILSFCLRRGAEGKLFNGLSLSCFLLHVSKSRPIPHQSVIWFENRWNDRRRRRRQDKREMWIKNINAYWEILSFEINHNQQTEKDICL